MRLRNLLIRVLAIVISIGAIHGAEILDTPVPWSGRISGYTLAELVARMRGWSDVGGSGTFRLSTQIPSKLATSELDLIRIADDAKPTYRELLVAAFKEVGQKIEVRQSKKGIEITYIYARSINLPTGTRQALIQKGRWSLDGIKSELDAKGWVLSEFSTLSFFPESSALIVQGTLDDLDKVVRFFGQK